MTTKPDKIAHRGAVEAGYANLPEYIEANQAVQTRSPWPLKAEIDDMRHVHLARADHEDGGAIFSMYASPNARLDLIAIVNACNSYDRLVSDKAELMAALTRAEVLLRLVTIRQAIEASDEAINAAGLNPYCMNEGTATGSEGINPWWATAVLAKVTGGE